MRQDPEIIDLSASLEDYLEAIFGLVEKNKVARSKDIAGRLKVSKSSVTKALRALSDRELINYTPYDVITLTDQGMEVAGRIAKRHQVLQDFFVKVLAVDKKTAGDVACRMEHIVPPGMMERLIRFVRFMDKCPRMGVKWTEGLGYHCVESAGEDDCEICLEKCLEDYRSRRGGESSLKESNEDNNRCPDRAEEV